jgi:hypothetical protein
MIKDGVGIGNSQVYGDKEAPDYVLSNSGNREANFSGDIKFTGKNRMFLPTTVITTLQLNFECFTYGECERFVQFYY